MLRNLGLEEDWKVWDLIGLISFKIGFGLGLAEVWNGMWIRIRRDYDGARYGFKIFQKMTRVKRYFQKTKCACFILFCIHFYSKIICNFFDPRGYFWPAFSTKNLE